MTHAEYKQRIELDRQIVTGKHGDKGYYVTTSEGHVAFIVTDDGEGAHGKGGKYTRHGVESKIVDRHTTKADVERKLVKAHNETGGNWREEHKDTLSEDTGHDLGPSAFVFHKQLPDEIRKHIEGNPAARRIFSVTQDARQAKGADTFAAMQDRYFDYVDDLAGSHLNAAKESARKSNDPETQFLAALHDNFPKRGDYKKTGLLASEHVKPGMAWTIHGNAVEVYDHPDNGPTLRGEAFPETPVGAMDHFPIDHDSMSYKKVKAKRSQAYNSGDPIPFSRTIDAAEYARIVTLSQGNLFGSSGVGTQGRLFDAPHKDKDGNKGRWVTISGAHIFIRSGETTKDAIRAKFGDKQGERVGKIAKGGKAQPGPGKPNAWGAEFEESNDFGGGEMRDMRSPAEIVHEQKTREVGKEIYRWNKEASADRDAKEKAIEAFRESPEYDAAYEDLRSKSKSFRQHEDSATEVDIDDHLSAHQHKTDQMVVEHARKLGAPVPTHHIAEHASLLKAVGAGMADDGFASAPVDNNRQLGIFAKDDKGEPMEVGAKPGQASLFTDTPKKSEASGPKTVDEKIAAKFDPAATAEMFPEKSGSVDDLMRQAEPHRQKGEGYNRNIADAAARIEAAMNRGHAKDSGVVKMLADELQSRLPSSPPTKGKEEKPAPTAKEYGERVKGESVPEIETYEEMRALPKNSVYKVKGRDNFYVRSGLPSGLGDTIHSTHAEARAQGQRENERLDQEARRKEQEQKAREDAAAAKEKKANLKGFADDRSALSKGKAASDLDKHVRVNGVAKTVREHVESMVAAGAKLDQYEENKIKDMTRMQAFRANASEQAAHAEKQRNAGKRTVYTINGYDLGKTAHEYATHLTSKPSTNLSASTYANRTASERQIVHLSAAPLHPSASPAPKLPAKMNGVEMSYYWADALHAGDITHPRTGAKLKFTNDRLDKLAANLSQALANGVDVPIVRDHKETADSVVGYLFDAKREGDKLMVLHGVFKDQESLALRNRISLGIDPDFRDGRGNRYGEAIRHSALTPIPVQSGQQGFRKAA